MIILALMALTMYGTSNEGVTSVSREACAHRLVIDNGAFGVLTAYAGAGIDTFVSYAHQVGRTIGINDAFGSAC